MGGGDALGVFLAMGAPILFMELEPVHIQSTFGMGLQRPACIRLIFATLETSNGSSTVTGSLT